MKRAGEILFLAHRVPFPPDRGDKIRSHHILRHLARIAPVHVATFGETDGDMAQQAELERIAASHCLVRRAKPLPLAGIEALATGLPVSLTAFRDRRIEAFVKRTLATRPIAAIYVYSGQMGQYVPVDWQGRLVCDLVDVDSAKFEAYARDAKGPMRFIYAREARLLAAEEARLAGRADGTLLVSEEEAALLRSRAGQGARSIAALRNGIDAAFFDPAKVAPHPDLAAGGPHITFTGQMDYAPNVAASLRIIERLLPAIREQHSGATFHCVGRAPTLELKRRDGEPGVRVWGEVPDVRPFLAGADLVLAPLEIARGVQNKVLEAMAMARPVLVTPGGATGIGATGGEHLAIAASDDALVAAAIELLTDSERANAMGAAARRFVLDHLSWEATLARLPELHGFASAAEGQRNAA